MKNFPCSSSTHSLHDKSVEILRVKSFSEPKPSPFDGTKIRWFTKNPTKKTPREGKDIKADLEIMFSYCNLSSS